MKPAEFNPFMNLNLRFQPGPHKWEASVLITASSPRLNALPSDWGTLGTERVHHCFIPATLMEGFYSTTQIKGRSSFNTNLSTFPWRTQEANAWHLRLNDPSRHGTSRWSQLIPWKPREQERGTHVPLPCGPLSHFPCKQVQAERLMVS